MTQQCEHNWCFEDAVVWADHPNHGRIGVCDEHADDFDECQEVLVV